MSTAPGVLARFANAPAETAEQIDELLNALIKKYSDLEDGKWVQIVDDFRPLALEEKSKKWLQNRAKKLASTAGTDKAIVVGTGGFPIAIEVTEKYGRALVAQKDIPAFSVIVAEPPLILGSAHSNEDEAEASVKEFCQHEQMNLETALKVINFLKSFCAADEAVKEKVLKCYASPGDTLPSSTQSALRLCDAILDEPWVNGVTKPTLENVVVVKTMNAHSFSSKSSLATAVFEHISLCNNACNPNAAYTSQCSSHPGCGCIIARRAIAAGEHVTLSYCEPLMPSSLRLPYLKEVYAFDCDCAACTADADAYSGVPCPRCNPRLEDGLLPDDAGSWHEQPGFVYCHPLCKGTPWICDECGQKLESNGIEVGGMTFERLERNLYHEHQSYVAHSREHLKISDLLYYSEYLWRHLGPRHGVSLQSQFLLCEALLAKPEQDLDLLEKTVDGLISVMKRNGEHPGEILPFLASAGHALAKRSRFAKAKQYYDTALEFNVVFGATSHKVKDLHKGLQACAKSDVHLIRKLV